VARGIITSARLSVGTVTTVSSLAPPSGGFVSTAYAQTTNPQPVVVRQSPVAGTMCVPGCPVDIFLSSGAQGMPEPSTLPMIAVALAVLGLLIWRRGRGVTNAAIVLMILAGCENRAVEDRIAVAKQFIESGRPNGAVVELKRAIQDEPGNAEARRLLGHAYVGLGQFQDAEKELTRAVSIDPDSAGSALALASVWLRQGEVAQLLSALQPDANWSTSEQSTAWSLRGEAELAAGRPQEARQSFERAASLDPDSIDPLIGLFRADSAADQPEAANAVLQRALALHPADPILLGLRGARSFKGGDFTAAEDAFRRQLERTPDNLGGRIDLAQALLAQGQDHQAQAELSRVLADAPNHPDAHYLMAVIDMRRANYTPAAEHAGRALQSRPQFLPARAIAARAAAELGRWEESRAQLDAIRVKDPMHPLLAELKPRLDEAMRTPVGPTAGPRPLEQDLALFRLDPPADPSLLDALAAPGTLPRSFETELARAGPSWLARGRALAAHRAGRPVEARFALQGALDGTPDDADTRRVLVDLYLLAGEPNAALPHLRRLVRDNPRDPGVLNNLAWTLYERGELREAALLSERALALAPRDPGVLDTRGMILLRSGEASRALELLGRAASTDLAPPESRVHLAQALIESGDKTAARQVLTITLNTPQDASAHRAASILLKNLEP
jgi:tetratricopeptide (TPR) repeat protein